MKSRHFFYTFAVGLLWSILGNAEIQIGHVLAVKGDGLQINSKKVAGPEPLLWGDMITSDASTNVSIVLYPGIAVEVSKATRVKLIGNLVEQEGKSLLSTAAIRLIQGKLQARVPTGVDQKYQLRVIGPRTITAVRGTTFEVSDDPTDEVFVEEGHVDVESLKGGESYPVSAGSGFSPLTNQKSTIEKKPFSFVSPDRCEAQWNSDKDAVLTAHQKLVRDYKRKLDHDVAKVREQLQLDIRKMLKTTKGHYDQFKTKKSSE